MGFMDFLAYLSEKIKQCIKYLNNIKTWYTM